MNRKTQNHVNTAKCMPPLITPQTNLAFQIVIIAVLFVALALKTRRKYFLHGTVMLSAVVLNGISFMMIMGSSLFDKLSLIQNYTFARLPLAIIGHATFGSLAELLGIWLIVSWHLKSTTQDCVKKRKMMRLTLVVWSVALGLGILVYVLQQ